MVALRIDPRVAARIDPSDVVQDALLEASHKLPEYLGTRPVSFYPWLRQIAWERLIDLHRRHLVAERRTVRREEPLGMGLSNTSATMLAKGFLASGSHPSRRLLHEELCRRIQSALAALGGKDREVLLLRYLEQLSTCEIAAVLGISEGAVKGRHRRAIQKLAELLEDDDPRQAQ